MDRNKLKLTFLLTVTVVPIALATWWFGMASQYGIGGTTNKGELVIPVLDLAELGLSDSEGSPAYQHFDEITAGVSPKDYAPRPWQLLYLGAGTCDEVCTERLYFLRQLHVRLGGEASRVQRVYVQVERDSTSLEPALATLLETEHPGLRAVFADPVALQTKLAASVPAGIDPVAQHYIYVADPVGNVMLYFTPENTPDEILSDLDKLLDQSSLG